MDHIKIEQHKSVGVIVWFGAWMFTAGFLKLALWPAIFAILIWPYYLGAYFAG